MSVREQWKFSPLDATIYNNCGAIFDEQILKEGLEYLGYKLCRRYISVGLSSTGYPVFRIHGHQIKLHRIIGQYVYQDNEGKYIYHHIDENKLNALPDNIMQTDNIEHPRHHNTGKSISEEHKLAISRAFKGKPSHNRRAIIALDKSNNIIGEYSSIEDAGQQLKIIRTAIDNNLHGRSKYCGGYKFIYKT